MKKMKEIKGQSILEAQQFKKEVLDELFSEADRMKTMCDFLDDGKISDEDAEWCKDVRRRMAEKRICLLFYEPSTRTWSSFFVASENLGGRVMPIPPAKQFSSVVKGETVKDTVAMFCGYGVDAIVMRTDKEGMAKEADEAARASGRTVSIINAGDGKGQHPTQSLLDLYTIKRFFGSDLKKDIHDEKISVAFVGDLANGRTVRSLAYLLNKYQDPEKLEFFFVSPTVLKMKDDIKEYLAGKGVKFSEHEKLIDVADKVNVCYMTRVQKERLEGIKVDYDYIRDNCSITKEVAQKLKKEAVVLHPLPRDPAFGEIPEWFDTDPRAKYIQQAENGLYVRMALLKKVLLG